MSVNKVILLGRVGKDPEVRYMPNGDAAAKFSLATSEKWKDKSGEQQERTEWHNVVVYRRLAEVVGEYVKKGSQLYAEGKLQTRKWQDKEGVDRYTTEVICDKVDFIGTKSAGSGNTPAPTGNQGADATNTGSNPDWDEDIPF